ncbi:MAG TPA: ABC transporter permease [Pseudogracilibacillus sp.]|nr:ABC transporter permease [Pseudogracilibacillus sp.]
MYELSDYFYIFVERYPDIIASLLRHLLITGLAISLGCIIAIPLGVYLAKTTIKWIQTVVFTITNIFQTIPSLAMLAIFIPIIGIGLKPAVVALFLYSLMPILRNTYAAFESIAPEITEAAKGMGYGSFQRLMFIEIPIAMPYIMSGVRLTMVYLINWATLAGIIGAGGLGELIIGGMGVNNKPLIFASAVTAMLLALVADFVFAKFENLFKPKEERKQIPIQMEEEL